VPRRLSNAEIGMFRIWQTGKPSDDCTVEQLHAEVLAELDELGISLFPEAPRRINGSEPNTFAKAAGCAVGGAWSVDILETKRGWFVTDMAEASKSFHWPECPYAGE
jgi:hypothetical protein